MMEDETAIISLPDRLSHVLDMKYDASPASAPSLLAVRLSHHVRKGSMGNYAGNDVDARSSSSPHTIEPNDEDYGHQRSSHQTDDVDHTDVAISGLSLIMPGRDTVEDLEQSAHELLSRMPKRSAESQLLPKMTKTPRTKLSEMQQSLSARKVASLKERHHVIFQELDGQETSSLESTDEDDGDVISFDTCLHDTTGACPAICLRKRTVVPVKLVDDGKSCSEDDEQGIEISLFEYRATTESTKCFSFASTNASGDVDSFGNHNGEEGTEYSLSEFVSKVESETAAPTSPLTLETFVESSNLLPWSEHELSPPSPYHEKNPSSIFDCVLDCFDRPVKGHYMSPQTVSSLCTHYDELPNVFDDVLPCWHDDLEDFREFKDYLSLKNSAIGEDVLQESKSKEDGSVDSLHAGSVFGDLQLDPETDCRNGTITFSIPIEMFARLKSRRRESISIFFDTLAFMCGPDNVDRVRRLQSQLTHNASSHNQALRTMEDIHEEKWEGADDSNVSRSGSLNIIPEGVGVVPERPFLFDIDNDDDELLIAKMDSYLEEAKEDLAKLKFDGKDRLLDFLPEESEDALDLREYGTGDDDHIADFESMLKEADDELTSLLSS